MPQSQAGVIDSLNFDLLNPDKNRGSYQAVSLTKGFDFVFVRPGTPNPAASTVRLFGDNALEGFTVEEISEGGSVPFLRAKNATAFDVLLLAGQLVQGGKQNRGINADMLVAAGQSAKIPVTCVEQGRWSGTPRSRFGHAGFEPIEVRSAKMRDVHHSRREGREAVANQERVWSKISEMSSSLGCVSPSSDLLESMRVVRDRHVDPSSRFNARIEATEVHPSTVDELRFVEGRLQSMQLETRQLMDQLHVALGDSESPQINGLRRDLDRVLREIALIQQQRDRLREQIADRANDPSGDSRWHADFTAADQAAQGASGMLVFFNGEFLAGDIFADPQWFSKVYRDLRDSALMSWEFVARRQARAKREMDPASSVKAASTARSVVRDALGGDWAERPAIAHGRSMLLEHPYLESAVLGGRDGSPLHLLVGTKQQPEILRTNDERPRRPVY